MDNPCMHQCMEGVDNRWFLFTWSISKASWISDLGAVQTMKFLINRNEYYFATLDGSEHGLAFSITSNVHGVKCSVSMFTGSGTLLFSNTLKEPTREDLDSPFYKHYSLMSLTCDDECLQTLKLLPNDSFILICRIILRPEEFFSDIVGILDESTNTLNYMKKLADTLKNSSEPLLKEKVTLRVGENTETVNKAVLCARSPVFADMFESNTAEVEDNVVTITDIKMPVLKVLVSFLYTGKLVNSAMASNSDFDVDFLCDLFKAANKYGIAELRHACVDLLLPQISTENIFQVSRFAFTHFDERLRSTVKTLIAANVDKLVDKNEWKDLINDEPQIVVEALTFFDI